MNQIVQSIVIYEIFKDEKDNLEEFEAQNREFENELEIFKNLKFFQTIKK